MTEYVDGNPDGWVSLDGVGCTYYESNIGSCNDNIVNGGSAAECSVCKHPYPESYFINHNVGVEVLSDSTVINEATGEWSTYKETVMGVDLSTISLPSMTTYELCLLHALIDAQTGNNLDELVEAAYSPLCLQFESKLYWGSTLHYDGATASIQVDCSITD